MAEKVCQIRARWGGSFWHHDVEDPKVRDAFERRIRRLLGMLPDDVPVSKTRVFVRTASSTLELDLTLQLYEALKEALPECRICLLIIVDLQETEEIITLQSSAGLDVLFFRASGHIFAETSRGDYGNFDRRKVAENYARGVSCAVNVWAAGTCQTTVSMETSLERVSARCDQMDSGDPGSDSFWPRRFRGQRFAGTPITMPRLFEEKKADFAIPNGTGEGDLLTMNVFGIEGIQVPIPPGGLPGHVLRLRFAEGKISSELIRTVASDKASDAVLEAPGVGSAVPTDVLVEGA